MQAAPDDLHGVDIKELLIIFKLPDVVLEHKSLSFRSKLKSSGEER